MLKRFAILFFFFPFSLIIFISCEKESNDVENLKDYRSTVETAGSKNIEYFFFVGKAGRETGLYKYNLNENKYELFWSAPKENVVQLSYSDNLEYAFFITARRLGVRRGVSFISRIKLYRLDLGNSSVELIKEIGDAVQLSAYWLDKNYKIQFTQFDMKIASHINKINQIYSPFGKLVKEEIEIFDFIKDGYPQFESRRVSLISPSGNFGIAQTADSIFLSSSGNEQKVLIDSTDRKIRKVKWSDDENYLFFTIIKTESDEKSKLFSELYIYNVIHQKLTNKFNSENKMSFIIANELLIFDASLNNQSSIVVYDYKKDLDVNVIKIRGGIGLFYISNK
jgi:hypothetical protein